MSGLTQSPDTGTWRLRRRVPQDSCADQHDLHGSPSPWLLGLLLALLVVALYTNSLHGEWILDDYADVLGPESVQNLWPLSKHFFQQAGGQVLTHPRPLVSLSFAINALFGRGDSFPFHATNVAIHLLATWCLFGLTRRTLLLQPETVWTPRTATLLAFLTALLWGIHPLQTEAVAYITQRYESLMGLFLLATLLCVARSARSRFPLIWTISATFSCLLALASKEVAISLPILVLLYDRAFLAGSFLGAWRARRALYLALGLVLVLFLWNQFHVIDRTFAGFGLPMPWWQYAVNQPAVIMHYLRLVFWPHPLVLDYGWPPATSVAQLIPGFLVLISLLVATLAALLKSPRWGFLGAFFFLILAPTSSFMPILDLAVEHRMYLPLAAVLTAVIFGLHHTLRWIVSRRPQLAAPTRLTIVTCGALVTAMLGSLTFLRSDDYRTALGLSLDTVLKRPSNPRAHINYAYALNNAGNLNEAIRQVRIAVQLAPEISHMRLTLGAFLELQGQKEEAIKELQHASRLSPGDPRPWMVLGEIHAKAMDLEKSAACFQMVLKLDPKYPNAHFELANVAATLGDLEAALGYYRKAAQLHPGFSLSHRGAGLVLLRQGRLAESLREFDTFVQLEPNTADAMSLAGRMLYAHDQAPEAIRYWQQALQRDPKHRVALLSLSWALSTNPQDSVRNGQKALELVQTVSQAEQDRIPLVLDVLGAAYAELGRYPEACAVLEEAIQKLKAARSPDFRDLQTRLALYRHAQPFRERPSKSKS